MGERWRRARDNVITQWDEFKRVGQEVKDMMHLPHQLKDLQEAHSYQKDALERARQRCMEITRLAEVVSHQQKLIAGLETQILSMQEQLGPGASAEMQLMLSKANHELDSLREAAKQLEVMSRSDPQDLGRS